LATPEVIERLLIDPEVDVFPLNTILNGRGVQIACNVRFAVGVSVVRAVVPVAVVAQPPKVYPARVIVPTVANEIIAEVPNV
jgi:hypothetical protein